ncbi:MAG: helix-turn-helix transcriptional regulator [Ruminococcus sp.]|nr:helix-turn-helix transcriptional regulator [Ruminococcus sp.]
MKIRQKFVGDRLRHYREACALSQGQVAKALNIDRSTYTKYETGETEPNLNTIVKIAAIYNVSPLELLPMNAADDTSVQKLKDAVQSDSPIYQLNKEERGLIALYRVLSKEQKQQAREMIGNMSKKEK